jgi:hypothetical protein
MFLTMFVNLVVSSQRNLIPPNAVQMAQDGIDADAIRMSFHNFMFSAANESIQGRRNAISVQHGLTAFAPNA